ncbi:MAG TPA: MTH1187 family thiamine-binding protein [Dehalococcoidales bacterium]|nr:MTH1187 family thiamine-binding protein [Dehalococcoidales bacterium]
MAIIEISVMPLGTGTPSLSKYVAGAMKVLQAEKNVKYEMTSMGTNIEGELEQLFDLARRMHLSAFDAGAQRVVTTMKIDERRDQAATIQSKVASVKRELEK